MASVTASDGSARLTLTAVTSAVTREGAAATIAIGWSVSGSGYAGKAWVNGVTIYAQTASSNVFINLTGTGSAAVLVNNPARVTLTLPITAFVQAVKGGAGRSASSSVQVTVPAATFTLTLNAGEGGAVEPATATVTYGEAYGELPTPTRPGWRFLGWSLQAEGGALITPETVVELTADATLYAVWEPDSFAGLYIARGGAAGRVREAYAVQGGQPVKLARAYAVRDGAVTNL